MDKIYQAICKQLLAKFEQIKHIDLFNEQLTDIEGDNQYNYAFSFPAIFIDIEQTYQDSIAGRFVSTATITVYIAQTSMADTHDGAKRQSKGLEVVRFANDVKRSLIHFNPGEGAGKMTPISFLRNLPTSQLVVFTAQYTCLLNEETAENDGLENAELCVEKIED